MAFPIFPVQWADDMPSDIQKIFDFTSFLEGFKKLERFVGQVFWRDYPQPQKYESDADHTWRMAMMLVLIEPHLSQPIDFKKAMKMALIHDVPEILAGDASPLGTDGTGKDSHAYNAQAAEEKHRKEKEAAQRIFGQLPAAQRDDLLATWQECEDQTSFEARVVKAIDKLEGKLQAFEYCNGVMYKEHHHFCMTYGNETYNADPATKEFGDILLRKFKENFQEFIRM